jgi:hypothetical protein
MGAVKINGNAWLNASHKPEAFDLVDFYLFLI